MENSPPLGTLSSRPDGWRRSVWSGGAFETAFRPHTAYVHGEIASDRHLVMATLRGGARRHRFVNSDGLRYDDQDTPGSVSFLPAGSVRKLELHDVEWRWAAIAIDPALDGLGAGLAHVRSIALHNEPVVFGLLAEIERLDALSGGVEPIYAETMSGAIAQFLAHKFGAQSAVALGCALPPFKLRRVREFIAANLAARFSLRDLARLCDLSERHFHRAFKASTSRTPLEYVTAQRIDRAKLLLASKSTTIAEVAFAVGFSNPSHFARAFSAATGVTPSVYRARSSIA